MKQAKSLTSFGGPFVSILALVLCSAMLAAVNPGSSTPGRSRGGESSPINPVSSSSPFDSFQFFTATSPPSHLYSVDWGELMPGENVTKNIYVTCSSQSRTYELAVTTSRWGPPEALDYLVFSENGTGQIMTGQSGVIGFSLQVFENCTGITWFSFDINVNFEEVT